MEVGDIQVGEVTRGGALHLLWKRDKIKTKDYMHRKVTPPKWVNSTTWGPPTSMQTGPKKKTHA